MSDAQSADANDRPAMYKRCLLDSGIIPAVCGLALAVLAVIQTQPWLAFMTLLLGAQAGVQLQTYVLSDDVTEAVWNE